ncbi:MAG: MBL fold metallo-hydrolase [Candidatus Aenigmatarchaeota archaeon]|nr:MBL fold metallo-hydrolase [Candidatus Aenigmarchaeota archaeon]
MVKLTFFGGVNEIGGNKILIETKKTRIFFDFGLSFAKYGKFYSDFLQPRVSNGIGDYLDLGIIPDLHGIYRNDLLMNEKRKTSDKPEVDGVVLSHAHADHSSNISLLHKDMNIFCGETSKIILKALQESSQQNFYTDYYFYKENFVNRSTKPKIERIFKTFRTGDKIKIGDFEIEPVHVDHSIPGAYGFVIHADGIEIAYTGDLRLHGHKSSMTWDFVKKAEGVDYLICEGTRVGNERTTMTENQVYEKVKDTIKSTKNLVIANFPMKDVDRFNSFFAACEENGRELAISTKLAYLLEELQADKGLKIPKLKDVKIYLHKASWGTYTENDYATWERKFLNYETVTADDVRKKQNKFVVFLDYYDLKELIDLKPEANSTYIYSTSEPHDEEQTIDYNRMMNWLNHFRLKFENAHASGHASENEIKEIIKSIKPKNVFPIHTQHPEIFKNFAKNVVFAEYEKSINLNNL